MITFSFLEEFFDFNYDNKYHEEDSCDSPTTLNDSSVSQLYVPQDPLHELEIGCPTFWNDLNLLGLNLISDDSNSSFDSHENLRTKAKDCDISQPLVQNKPSFIKKKPRTRKTRRKRTQCGTWARFGFENSKANKEKKCCSHCETNESPLWRVGPLGKNTLCNACGVRYKSGRLLPEYRPFSSPTFDGEKHSNYHRKILKNIGQS